MHAERNGASGMFQSRQALLILVLVCRGRQQNSLSRSSEVPANLAFGHDGNPTYHCDRWIGVAAFVSGMSHKRVSALDPIGLLAGVVGVLVTCQCWS